MIKKYLLSFIFCLGSNFKQMKKEEWFPLVDEEGNITGRATRKECHGGSLLLHPVVHLHIFNQEGKLFLQKRATTKDIQPGKWDTAVGGHIDFGEGVQQALIREAKEELGITGFTPEFCHCYIWESPVERELVYTYRTIYEGKMILDQSELDDGRFWSISEIEKQIDNNVFTPNFEKEFSLIKEFYNEKNTLPQMR